MIGAQCSKQCGSQRGAALSQMVANVWPRPQVPQALSSSCMSYASWLAYFEGIQAGIVLLVHLTNEETESGRSRLQPIVFVPLPWGGHTVTDRVSK